MLLMADPPWNFHALPQSPLAAEDIKNGLDLRVFYAPAAVCARCFGDGRDLFSCRAARRAPGEAEA
jgi:hypothetical protein